MLTSAPRGPRRTVKLQRSYYHSSCNINPRIISPLSPPLPLPSPATLSTSEPPPARREARSRGILAAEGTGANATRRKCEVPARSCMRASPGPAGELLCTHSEVLWRRGGASSCKHTRAGARSQRQHAETEGAHSECCELFTYAGTILGICIRIKKKERGGEDWNSLIECAGVGVMHL